MPHSLLPTTYPSIFVDIPLLTFLIECPPSWQDKAVANLSFSQSLPKDGLLSERDSTEWTVAVLSVDRQL